MNDLNIKINEDISEDLLNIKLLNTIFHFIKQIGGFPVVRYVVIVVTGNILDVLKLMYVVNADLRLIEI